MIETDRLQNSSVRGINDIRCQWTTYETLNQWFDDAKPVLLKYKFAEDKKYCFVYFIFIFMVLYLIQC